MLRKKLMILVIFLLVSYVFPLSLFQSVAEASSPSTGSDCTITSTVTHIFEVFTADAADHAIGQSFTACKDGRIKELRLLSFTDSLTYQGAGRNELTISLYRGDGLAGDLLGTFTFETTLLHEATALNDYSIIPMSDGNFVLNSGEVYTFNFAGGGTNTFYAYVNDATFGVPAPYPGGSLYYEGAQYLDRDLMFQLVMEDELAANDPPTDILLSNSSVNQSAGVNAVVGTLSSIDPDDGDSHTYSLVAGAGDTNNGSFNISGNQLRANNTSSLAAGNYTVRIRTIDSAANTFEKAFTLTVLDDVPPVVNSVAVPPSDIYSTGHSLDFTVNASEALMVNTVGGTPRITLDIGGTSRFASYLSGSGTTALMFRYTVQASDNDLDGIEVSALQLNGGTIRDNASNNLNLTLNSVGNTTGILVDTMPPSITAIANQTVGVGLSTAALSFTIGDNLTAAGSLSVNRASSNTIAVPLANVVLGGSGANRTVTITGADTGTSTITITVTDAAGNSAQQAFQVEVTPPSYTVNFVDWDGTVLKTETVSHGSSATAPTNPSRTGHSFTGWSPGDFSNITADTTITAQYSINSYMLTFDSAGGSAVAAITQEFGSAITPPADPSRVGHTFTGWNPAIPASMPAENRTLTAQWNPHNYIVNFLDWNGFVLKSQNVSHGNSAIPPADPSRTGYTFTGWNPSDLSNITASTHFTAQFSINSYTLTFDSAGGSAVAAITQNFGSAITPPANPSRVGHTFTGWNPAIPANMPAENITITAQWSADSYTVSFDSDGGSAVADITADFGTVITPPVDPTREGYTFAGWYKESGLTTAWKFENDTVPANNITLYAKWNIEQYSVTFSLDGGTSVPIQTVDHNQKATRPASDPIKAGHNFGGWYTDSSFTTEFDFENTPITENTIVYAQWIREISSNADLSNLVLSNGMLSPVFDSNTIGYTAIVANAVTSISVTPTVADGNATVTANGTPVTSGQTSGSISLSVGANTITVVVTAEDASTKTYTISITRSSSSGGSSSGGGSTVTQPQPEPAPVEDGTEVLVNGQAEQAGTYETIQDNGNNITTVTLDDNKIEERLASEGGISKVTIPFAQATNVATAQLNAQTVKNMGKNNAILEMKTEKAIYTLPTAQIDIDRISAQIGRDIELSDINVSITITESSEEIIKIIEDTANQNNHQVVVKPVEFKIEFSSGEKTVEVTKFNAYVERMIAVPEGINSSKISTGVVLNNDRTFTHVPTTIIKVNERYYARISSLTNSTYSVIWNLITVASVENHWSKEIVNDMASRLVIKNIETFNPEGYITRGEFAEYITKALGIYRTGVAKFSSYTDVDLTNELADAIELAKEYGIIEGYPDGTFRSDAKISREEAMIMYARAMDIVGLNEIDNRRIENYKDKEEIADWAYDFVKKTVSLGVFNGRTAETINPKDTFTYAEAATAISNLLVKSGLIND